MSFTFSQKRAISSEGLVGSQVLGREALRRPDRRRSFTAHSCDNPWVLMVVLRRQSVFLPVSESLTKVFLDLLGCCHAQPLLLSVVVLFETLLASVFREAPLG